MAAVASAPGPVDLAQIQRLTNIADVTRLLHETVVRERAIDAELDRQLSKRTDLERNFLLLNTPTAEARPRAALSRAGQGPWPAQAAGARGRRPLTCEARAIGHHGLLLLWLPLDSIVEGKGEGFQGPPLNAQQHTHPAWYRHSAVRARGSSGAVASVRPMPERPRSLLRPLLAPMH